jgi:hypothetical protein
VRTCLTKEALLRPESKPQLTTEKAGPSALYHHKDTEDMQAVLPIPGTGERREVFWSGLQMGKLKRNLYKAKPGFH